MKKLNTQHILYTLTDDDILIARFKSDVKLKIEDAKVIVSDRKAFAAGKNYPVLSDIRNINYAADTQTRDYLQSNEAREGVLAAALLTDSIFTNYLGNLFLKVAYKIKTVPTQIFMDEKKALDWLKTFVK